MYSGDRECAGCGTPGSERSRSYADSLCGECERALEIGYGMKDNAEDRYAGIYFNPHNATEFHFTEQCGDWNERMREQTKSPPYLSDSDFDHNSKTLQNALKDFLQTLDVGSRPRDHVIANISNKDTWSDDSVTVYYSQGKMFYKFWEELCLYIRNVEKKNFNRGVDMLKGLNSGDITLDDLEENIKRMNQR